MNELTPRSGDGQVWQVSELNREVRDLLERGFGTVWVEAEISNLARPASGHLYFSLKDASAQLRAAFFRQRQRASVRDLANGDQVLVRGRLSLYEPRGDYQLIVEHLEPAGEGALRRAFEQLKRQLAAEGLFDPRRKQSLPAIPRRIAVVTSPTGAAVRDVLKVLRRRMPGAAVRIYPASVQGAQAPAELVRAIERANAQAACDVLLLVRGGGSMEDLAAFNDERVARAVAASTLPVVSGVGHETDTTIVDYVADRHAPTPSAAAEISTPDADAILHTLMVWHRRLARAEQRLIQALSQQLDYLRRRLAFSGPSARLQRQRERLARVKTQLSAALRTHLAKRTARLTLSATRLNAQPPSNRLQSLRIRLGHLSGRLALGQKIALERRRGQVASLATHLHAISPLATLERGYAIVTDPEGRAIGSAADVSIGQTASVRLGDGAFKADVTEVTIEKPKD